MLSYILSFFRKTETPDTSLNESIDNSNIENGNLHAENTFKSFYDENYFTINTGTITAFKDNIYTIDDAFKFNAEINDFYVGAEVSYHRVVSDGIINIYNVNIVTDDWDVNATKQSPWFTRVLISKVEKRDKRTLFLSPGDFEINLDKISIEFVPITGDWLQLDVKCAVEEHTIDLSGKILEITKISPLRPHIKSAVVTSYDRSEKQGTLNRNIFFKNECLTCGYIPSIGDNVISEIIESDQGNCTWRAVKIIPEYIKKKIDENRESKNRFIEKHDDLEIEIENLELTKLNEVKEFVVRIKNVSDRILTLTTLGFPKNNSQCRVLRNFEAEIRILPESFFEINFECTAKNIGVSSDYLLLYFDNYTIGKWININVSLNTSGLHEKTYYTHKPNLENFHKSNARIIRGQNRTPPNRFSAIKIPNYGVPQRLIEISCDVENLKRIKPVLFTNLNPMNYEEKFHTLLHLDEIANLIAIRKYDLQRACFITNKEYLMLEIENLCERRPSIVLGDKIIAGDPLKQSNNEYEGVVHKVGAKHVFLKFSPMFHERYNGEDYSIRVIPGRGSYRRLHHAIYLAARNFGKDLLFPTKITEREARTEFVYDNYKHDGVPKKHLTPKDVFKRMKEVNCKLKLEWYNEKLNCKQKDAVVNAVKGVARPLPYIIFGPPGTGKTVTLVEIIMQIVRLIPESRLLVTAPSNSAADLIALRLIRSGILKPGDLVRLISLNYATSDTIPSELVPYCATASQAREGTKQENVLTQNGMTLDCSHSVLGRHKITVSTCSSAGNLHSIGFPKGHFTHIIVDEAGQAAEPEVMIPCALLDKTAGQVILAGDPMQLGPVILCKIASECGLNESLLERFLNRFPYIRDPESFPNTEGYDPRLVTKLLYNYRSLSPILHLFSSLFYNGDLIPTISDAESDEMVLLQKLKNTLPNTKDNTTPSVVFHGVNGENFQTADSPSWYNPHEVAQVFYYVNEFYRLGLTAKNIGIITPYTKQAKEIKHVLREAEFDLPKIGTVEEFQGQEFDVVLLSTVRSRQDLLSQDVAHSLGFVSSPRRLNVAISRAKALLVILGNPNLLCFDAYWRSVIQYCIGKGGYTGCDVEF